ncbi:MAG: aconitase X, partial [Thermodesulfobacteriota bacterium]|nr:aconitase X [Thermodesulfobacteriota bacterium]
NNVSTQAVVQLGAALATAGAVPLFHIFETTPEIRSNPYKYGGKSIKSEVTVTQDDIKKTCQELNTTQNREIDFVALGCPHYTFDKIREIASFLEGKRIKNDVEVWICTSQAIRNLALRSGEVQIIERAGAKVVVDTCMVLAPVKQIGFRNMATDSAKAQFYVSGFGIGVRFGNTNQCLQAALTGQWEK